MNNSPGLETNAMRTIGDKGAIREIFLENPYGVQSAILGKVDTTKNPDSTNEISQDIIQVVGTREMLNNLPDLISQDYYREGKIVNGVRDDMKIIHNLAYSFSSEYLKRFAELANEVLSSNKNIIRIGMGTNNYNDEAGDLTQLPTIIMMQREGLPIQIGDVANSFEEMDKVVRDRSSLLAQATTGGSLLYTQKLLKEIFGKTTKDNKIISEDGRYLLLGEFNKKIAQGAENFTLAQRDKDGNISLTIANIRKCVTYGLNLALR